MVGTLGNLLAFHVTAANEQDREQVGELAKAVQEVTGDKIKIMFGDQGYAGENPAEQAANHGVILQVVKRPDSARALFFCQGAGWWSVLLAG